MESIVKNIAKLVLGFIAVSMLFVARGFCANNVYSSFEIFEQDFQVALEQADAKFELAQCTLNSLETTHYKPDCTHSIAKAIEANIPYRNILSKLILKVLPPSDEQMVYLNEELEEWDKDIHPEQATSEVIQELILAVKEIEQKYSQ